MTGALVNPAAFGRGQRLPTAFIERHRRSRIAAALAIFTAREGFTACTVADVVRVAGMSRKTFYEIASGNGYAVAMTIAEPVRGFQGWRRRWWSRDDEFLFSDWEKGGTV